MPPLLDIPFVGTPQAGHPIAGFIVSLTQKEGDCFSSGTLEDQYNKWTCVDSQEVEVRSEHSSTKGDENILKLAPEARTSSEPQEQEPTSPLSSPTKATTDPGDSTVVGTLGSTRDKDSESNANHSWASSNLETSRENLADLDMESASRDCFMCFDTDEVPIRITQKKYRKRVQASCSQGMGGLWSEVQLKWIGNNHKIMWGHDHEIVRMEQNCTLGEDYGSFKMHKMLVRTNQLLHIAEATNLKVYT